MNNQMDLDIFEPEIYLLNDKKHSQIINKYYK